MLRNLQHHTIKYLVDELPPFTGILLIKTNEEGNIIDFHGPHKKYLRAKPEIGSPIHEFVPALFSMIPPLVSPMVLNRIQSNSLIYADIHLIESNENEYLIFIVDQTHEVESIRDIMQKINENKFRTESNKTDNKDQEFNPFVVFDYLNLKIIDDENAVISSDIPNWFNILQPDLSKNQIINISEIFPYFEVFYFEANDFWEKKENGKIKSGIWSETINKGEDIALTAYAIYYNNEKYILIRPEEEIDKEQLALQLAREQKLAYEKLEKTEKKLKTLLEYKDKFVSIVSHDLRSPVAAVLGIAEMLVNDEEELSKLDDFYVEMIGSIKDEMLRLLDYNDKLYHWSNLELGNFEIVKRNESLKKIIKTAHRTADQKLKYKNISFSTNLKNNISIDIDITLFLQVLNNLLSNAIKFTPENGSIAIDITNNKGLQIIVVDSGVGMPKKICENIFSGFARNSSMGTHGEKGTGLGLGIVKKIIDAHGFSIKVESELGKGSKFIIGISNFTQ
ncbi:MAG: HAMP domain-containing sensor histidine kinase [Bacteroidota bacterium]